MTRMSSPRSIWFPLALCILSGIPAAGQKHIPPEVVVSTRSGPIELTLSLYKRKIKVGKSLWYQVRLKNVGKEKLRVTSRIFGDPWAMRQAAEFKREVFLEALDPHGHPVPLGDTPRWPSGDDHFSEEAFFPVEGTPEYEEMEALRTQWRKQGLDEIEITVRLSHKFRPPAPPEDNSFWLEPGASTTTWAWSSRFGDLPISQYADMYFYPLRKPGQYRIRAVYDDRTPPEVKKILDELKIKIKDNPGLMVATPYVTVRALP